MYDVGNPKLVGTLFQPGGVARKMRGDFRREGLCMPMAVSC